jgi:V/A-type H+/Na+-transporting ATPase subunit C
MTDSFLYANGRISGLGHTLLDDRMWQMLILSDDEADLLRFLGDTWYGRFMQQHSLEDCFDQAMASTEDELMELSEDPGLVKGILHRRDVRNARYLWKDAVMAEGASGAVDLERPGLLPAVMLSKAVLDRQTREELPRFFGLALEEILLLERPTEASIDSIMDRLAASVENSELPAIDPRFGRFIRDRMEQRNFLTAGRSRLAGLSRQETAGLFLEGGHHAPEEVADAYQRGTLPESLAETAGFDVMAAALGEALGGKGFQTYSRECERHLLGLLDQDTFLLFGPSPLAAFVIRREMEIAHLRLIAAAKAAGVPAARLQDRLPRG